MSRKEHPIWENELMPYVDGQLDASEASAITEHLEKCENCAVAVAKARTLSSQMAEWKVEEPSKRLDERVLGELRSRRNWRLHTMNHWWSGRHAWAYGLSGAFVVVLLVAFGVMLERAGDRLTEPQAVGGINTVMHPGTQVWRSSQGQQGQQGGQGKQGQQGGQGKQGQQGQQAQEIQQGGTQGTLGRLLQSPSEASRAAPPPQTQAVPSSGPMIIRTAHLTVVTRDFDRARSRIEAIVTAARGYFGLLTVQGEAGSGRKLSATLRLPADQLDSALVELRKVGTVREESQNSSDVTSQYVDLQARITNSHNTEQRLITLLRERTGKLSDVLSAEAELSRAREEIERMEAQRKDLDNRVQFATIQIEMSGEYRAAIEPAVPSAGTRIRNAGIHGYRNALEGALELALFLLRYGPSLLLWASMLIPVGLGVRYVYRSNRLS